MTTQLENELLLLVIPRHDDENDGISLEGIIRRMQSRFQEHYTSSEWRDTLTQYEAMSVGSYIRDTVSELSNVYPLIREYAESEWSSEKFNILRTAWLNHCNTMLALKQSLSASSMVITRKHPKQLSRTATIKVDDVQHNRVMAVDLLQNWIEVEAGFESITDYNALTDTACRIQDGLIIKRIYGKISGLEISFTSE